MSKFLYLFCLVTFFITVPTFTLFSQTYTLDLYADDPALIKKLAFKRSFSSKEERSKELNKIVNTFQNDAYLTASIDSMVEDSMNLKAFLHTGTRYEWAYLQKGNVEDVILNKSGFNEKLYQNKPFHYSDIVKLKQKIIQYCENNGYPFASVRLDSIDIDENKFSANLHLEKNKLVKIDSVIVNGSEIIAPVYLYNYLGIKPGNLYNEALIKGIGKKIKEISFLKETQPYKIEFNKKYTKLTLNMAKQRGSQFDGFVGVMPNNTTGKVLFTGDVRLKLQNMFRHGELLELNWRSLQQNTQDLKTNITYPFLLSTPVGIDYLLKIYRKDTSFIDVQQNFGLQYMLTLGNYFKVFVKRKNTNILSTQGLTATELPAYADVDVTFYGMGTKLEKLDYRLNPRRGYSVLLNASVGSKNIKKNPAFSEQLYENVQLKTVQYTGDVNASIFIPFKARSTIKLSTISATLMGSSLFKNELFRIGGLKTLRGFNEESIWASSYSIWSLEYRYIMEENSYLYLFYDQAFYEENTVQEYVSDSPFGFGAGITFETKAGIFSINYALGKQFDNPILFREGKIHFGVVNYF